MVIALLFLEVLAVSSFDSLQASFLLAWDLWEQGMNVGVALLYPVLSWQFHLDSLRRRMAVGMTINDLNITEFLVRCKSIREASNEEEDKAYGRWKAKVNLTLHFLGLDIEQEMMTRFIFMMKMGIDPDQLFEQVVIGQDFSDSGGKNCSIVMTKRCILKMREESLFIKICFQELRQCYDTVEEYMGEPDGNEVQVAGEVASKPDVKFPLDRNHEMFSKLKRDNKEIKQGIYRLMQHISVDQQLKSFKKEIYSRLSYLESRFNEASSVNKYLHSKLSYLESRLNEALSENKDLRRELESSKSKEVRKPFHYNSRRFEKKGISKRFFHDTRDELYSAEGVCDRTSSGEVLQHCMLFIELLF